MTVKTGKLSDFIPDPNNANKGSPRGMKMLDNSLRQYGVGRSLVSDKNNILIAGNKTQERAIDIGIEDAIIVETDGSQVVIVKRTDLDLNSEDGRARALAVYDNRTGEIDLSWDPDQLKLLPDELLLQLWTPSELKIVIPEALELDSNGGGGSSEDAEMHQCPKCGFRFKDG